MTTPAPLLDLQADSPTLLTVRGFRHKLRDCLSAIGMPDRAAQDLLLALQEHGTNVIAHGKPAPRSLRIRLVREGAHWSLTIQDDGGPFNDFDGYMALATWADRRTSVRSSGMGLRFIGTRFPDHGYQPGSSSAAEPNTLTLTFPPRAQELLRPLVVVVEDDPIQRMMLKLVMSEEFRVVDFGRAEQALRVLRNHQADLIVSDIEMPEMDGFALRRELAKDHRTDTMPFVFLTAHDDDRTADLAGDLHIDDFMAKPIDAPVLVRTARRLITRARGLRDRLVLEGVKEATESLAIQVPAKVGNVEIAAASQSASAGGGDVVQTARMHGRSVTLLADVMGHGLAARFFAHGVAAYFRSVVRAAPPAAGIDWLMTALSDALYNDPTFAQTIVSAQLLSVDRNDTVEIVSAGHPFPVRLTGDGPSWVEIGGPLLGLAEELAFPSRRITLNPGDRLIAYTDGLTEIGNARRDPGEAARRLFDYVRLLADRPVGEGLQAILERHREGTSGSAPDDVTALVLGR